MKNASSPSWRLFAASLLLSLVACATDGTTDRGLSDANTLPPDVVIRSYTPQPGLSGVMPAMARHRVVFVGESHGRYDHHLAQLMVIRALRQQHPQLAIGLEFFQQPYQAVLDDYIAGRIDETEMLRRSEYFSRWGYDYRLYRPILRYARQQHIPLVALNLPRELTGRIGEVGLDGLSASEVAQLPDRIDRSDTAYRQRLLEVYKRHNGNTGHAFERFLDVQLAWDEGMAARAAAWLRTHPLGYMVVLAGSGHINADATIPQRLKRRMPVDIATVVLSGTGGAAGHIDGDYYLITEEQPLPSAGLLGVFLNNSQQPPRITGFSKTSDALRQGARKGDGIIAINGAPITDYTDLKLALLERRPGERVALGLLRRAADGSEQHLVIQMALQ